MKKILFFIVTALLFTACGETIVDGSTQQTYKESIKEITENVPRKKSTEFKDAISIILLNEATKKHSVMSIDVKPSMLRNSEDEMIDIIDGKNADEVIAIGKEAKRIINCASWERTLIIIEGLIPLLEERGVIAKLEKAQTKKVELEKKLANECKLF